MLSRISRALVIVTHCGLLGSNKNMRMINKMAENKMTEVAKLFGKQLGEEFKMKMGDAVFIAMITEYGMVVNDCQYHHWAPMLIDLLMGKAVIIDG
jgi:hypothetical protein